MVRRVLVGRRWRGRCELSIGTRIGVSVWFTLDRPHPPTTPATDGSVQVEGTPQGSRRLYPCGVPAVDIPSQRDITALGPYDAYVDEVEEVARALLARGRPTDKAVAALDGAPSAALSALVPLATRRALGAFFTSGDVRDVSFRSLLPTTRRDRRALDPACGAGDLLLSWTDTLPAGTDLESTLRRWGPLISGGDIAPSFVRLTRARLVLAAAKRVPRLAPTTIALEDAFPGVRVSNAYERLSRELPRWTLMNPPFGRVAISTSTTWTSGSVSEAAILVERFLHGAAPGQSLVAVLPDVLRTGSTLGRWRALVESMATVSAIRPIGQFNRHADIDVFVARFRRANATKVAEWWPTPKLEGRPLSEVASIRVGPLVPFRHEEQGAAVPYVHPQNLPLYGTAKVPSELRRFAGPLVDPPFIAVRRTSRPGDRPRAKAVVIDGQEPVAVENHLLVITPVSGTLQACKRLAASLVAEEASRWLDARLRGRHLTVTAMGELPVRAT